MNQKRAIGQGYVLQVRYFRTTNLTVARKRQITFTLRFYWEINTALAQRNIGIINIMTKPDTFLFVIKHL